MEGDIRDPAAVGRFCAGAEGATVFHLAGLIHPKRIRELFEINTEGTRHLLAAASAAGVRRIVATSSNSPAGVSGDPTERFDESSPYKPVHGLRALQEADGGRPQRSPRVGGGARPRSCARAGSTGPSSRRARASSSG